MPLNIIVTVKQVMDPSAPQSTYRVDREKKRLDTDPSAKISQVINGFDENGVEAALRIKDALKDVKITVLSAGASFTMDVIKKALAMGSDEMVLVQDPALDNVSDSTITAKVLAAAVKKIGSYDLIIAGRQASDWDNAQVPLGIAELLGVGCICLARKVEVKDREVICGRATGNVQEVVSATLPAVVTVSNELGLPRYPTLRNIMAAARKQPTVWSLADLGLSAAALAPKLKMVDLFIPKKLSRCEVITGEDDADAGRQLALTLREAKLL